jgi:hypothetical protein
MNQPRGTDTDDIAFLVAAPHVVRATEAARAHPLRADAPAHDACTRRLHRLEPDPAARWHAVAPRGTRGRGVLVVADTPRDQAYARKMERVQRHWSGTQHAVGAGSNLITLRWSAGESLIPGDGRVSDKPNDGITQHEHPLAMRLTACGDGSGAGSDDPRCGTNRPRPSVRPPPRNCVRPGS